MGADDTKQLLHGVSETKTAIAAGELIERHRSTPKHAEGFLHGKPFVILRDGDGTESIEYVDEQMLNPTFRKGTVALGDAPSFIAYFTAHANENSAIYSTIDPCRFIAVLDEHPGKQNGAPQWREFRATFAPALSKEWQTWMGHNGFGKAFDSTEEFAYFIEDNAPDFVDPEAAAMMDMALNFKVASAASYRAVQRLQDGNVDLQYVNDVKATAGANSGSVKVPEQFVIEIPLFSGLSAPPRRIEARFRFRLHEGRLKLWYELVRPHRVLEAAFKDLIREVSDGTTRDVLIGTTD